MQFQLSFIFCYRFDQCQWSRAKKLTFVSGLYKAIVVFRNGLVNDKLISLNVLPRYKSNAKRIFVLRSVTELMAYKTPHTINISPTCKSCIQYKYESMSMWKGMKHGICGINSINIKNSQTIPIPQKTNYSKESSWAYFVYVYIWRKNA